MPGESSSPTNPRAPDTFLVLYPFMWKQLDLKGVELLVFARAYGFCKNGGSFYESRARTASYLGISERSVTRAMGSLVSRGVLIDVDPYVSLDGLSTKTYELSGWAERVGADCTGDKLTLPDDLSAEMPETGEGLSDVGVPSWHLKSKSESKLE